MQTNKHTLKDQHTSNNKKTNNFQNSITILNYKILILSSDLGFMDVQYLAVKSATTLWLTISTKILGEIPTIFKAKIFLSLYLCVWLCLCQFMSISMFVSLSLSLPLSLYLSPLFLFISLSLSPALSCFSLSLSEYEKTKSNIVNDC